MKLVLGGCRAEPFNSYLKSLAIIKLIGEQKDPDIRGWWDNGFLTIETVMDKKQVLDFFQMEYEPTPIVAPWNGASGFNKGDDRRAMDRILETKSQRFKLYRDTIATIEKFPELNYKDTLIGDVIKKLEDSKAKKKSDTVEDIKTMLKKLSSTHENVEEMSLEELISSGLLSKDETRKLKKIRTTSNKEERSESKIPIINACRDRLCPRVVEWIDASVIINAEGRRMFPPLLGSGGNEGRLEYSRTYMDNLDRMLLDNHSNGKCKSLLLNAIFGEDTDQLEETSIGKFDPGRSGGYNQGNGIENKDFPINPWDFILLMEGTLLWSSGIGKRYASSRGGMQTPFTVSSSPVGYSSSSDSDRKGSNEIWVPVWKYPVGITELRALFREGRSTIRGREAVTGLEFTKAVSSLGVDRGIKEFVRYNLLKRRGDSYIALPTGHIPVQMNHYINLINELDPVLKKIDRFLKKLENTPGSYITARRNIDEAIYDLSINGDPRNVQFLVKMLGKFELLIANRNHNADKEIEPLNGLSGRWLLEADDGSLEYRIAVSLASIRETGGVGPIRSNLEGVSALNEGKWADGNGQFAWEGNSFTERLSNILYRRLLDAERLECKNNPLWGSVGLSAEDIAHYIEGGLDEDHIEELLFGLMLVRWDDRQLPSYVKELERRWSEPVSFEIIPRLWALLKLLFLPSYIAVGTEKIKVKSEKKVILLLNAGRIEDASRIAKSRLFASGIITFKASFPDTFDGTRLAAALLIPIRKPGQLTRLVLERKGKEHAI